MEFSKRTHGLAMKRSAEREGLTPSQIRANKCAQSKARGKNRMEAAQSEANARNSAYGKLSLAEKLSRNSTKVRKKLQKSKG